MKPYIPNADSEAALPAWEPFRLDYELLTNLRLWNKKNQTKRLPAILKSLTDTIESHGARLVSELIPNVPFPAGTLVKGLVGFLVLGLVRKSSICHLTFA
jgi:hypothetical protein